MNFAIVCEGWAPKNSRKDLENELGDPRFPPLYCDHHCPKYQIMLFIRFLYNIFSTNAV